VARLYYPCDGVILGGLFAAFSLATLIPRISFCSVNVIVGVGRHTVDILATRLERDDPSRSLLGVHLLYELLELNTDTPRFLRN
jgi:hypothetical protein